MPDGRSDLSAAAERLGLGLSDGQVRDLSALEQLLVERAIPSGLIASSDAPALRSRHVIDCLRGAAAVAPTDRDAYDLGSGAGLPGLVVAIACPGLSLSLVEARRRRLAFLELAVERLGLPNVRVVSGRVEELHEPVDVCFARAFAPLDRTWRLASRILRDGGRLVFFAGERTRVPESVTGARSVTVLASDVLARSGPLVIMSR
jgi:16S rRNA (guanine527-N7)-methyltransferase